MNHLARVSRTTPAQALSLIEADGLSQFIGRVLGTLTSLVAFWNLAALPQHEINNDHKGL